MKKIGYLFLLIAVGIASYFVGWWRAVQYSEVIGAIAHGTLELAADSALRRGDTSNALKLLDLDVKAAAVTLTALRRHIPAGYTEAAEKLIRAADRK